MKTVDKAVKLLNLFSVTKPEIGLSELARMAGYDKAATRRFLVALQKHQFIEQNLDTRAYRLGIGFLLLAKIREASTPLETIIQTSLVRLMQETNETAHASLMTNQRLSTIGISFPNRANLAHLELGEVLPLHATASGIVFQAFSSKLSSDELSHNLEAFTDITTTDSSTIKIILENTRQQGYAIGSGIYCKETTGMAVPYFDKDGNPMGTIAVATPTSRITDELKLSISTALTKESQKITHLIGGQIPESFIPFIDMLQG